MTFFERLIAAIRTFLFGRVNSDDGSPRDDETAIEPNLPLPPPTVGEPVISGRPYMVPAMVDLLARIRHHEAGSRGYNANYRNNQNWILTGRTFDEVRALGRSQVTTYKERSSAIGGYQFITATLDSLKSSLGLTGKELFDVAFQDDLAIALMIRRGLMKYLRGELSAEAFANNLAKEWASLPVVTPIKGASRQLKAGQSYYAGDGLNKALTTPGVVISHLRALKAQSWL